MAAPAPFIVCYPRSGSTLLRLMLDAHPQLAIPPETHFNRIFLSLAKQESVIEDRAHAVFEAVTGSERWPDFQIDTAVLRHEVSLLAPDCTIAEALRVFYRLYAARHRKPRWGDKTPGHLAAIVEIGELLPEARIIHLVRDGRDVAASMRHLWFGPGDDIKALARDWAARLSDARAAAQSLGSRYFECRYEDLVAEPEQTLCRIAAVIDIGFDPAMLRHQEHAPERLAELGDLRDAQGRRISGTDRQRLHQRALGPPDTGQVGRWRRDLSPEEGAAFQRAAGEMLAELGYE